MGVRLENRRVASYAISSSPPPSAQAKGRSAKSRRPRAASRLCALFAASALLLPTAPAHAHGAEPTQQSAPEPPAEPPLKGLTPAPPDAPDLRIPPLERPFELIEVPPLDEHVLVIIEPDDRHREEPQMHPMPVPMPFARLRDKKLRHDRGMLAGGVIFTAVCGVAAGLALYAFIDRRGSVYGQNSRDNAAAFTGLLSCTAGALALAVTGATRLKKRRQGR